MGGRFDLGADPKNVGQTRNGQVPGASVKNQVAFAGPFAQDPGEKGEEVTWSIVLSMNGDMYCCIEEEMVNTKLSQIRGPGNRVVFLDEGKWPHSPWGLHATHMTWWDQPTIRHSEGTDWAFADGHADYHKWEDQATKELAVRTGLHDGWLNLPAKDSPNDFAWLARGIFGDILYE